MPVAEKKLQMVMHQPVTTTGNNVTAKSMPATDVDDGDDVGDYVGDDVGDLKCLRPILYMKKSPSWRKKVTDIVILLPTS